MVSREELAAAVDGVNRSGRVSDYRPFGSFYSSLRPGPPSKPVRGERSKLSIDTLPEPSTVVEERIPQLRHPLVLPVEISTPTAREITMQLNVQLWRARCWWKLKATLRVSARKILKGSTGAVESCSWCFGGLSLPPRNVSAAERVEPYSLLGSGL
jgi:hypothetical protein